MYMGLVNVLKFVEINFFNFVNFIIWKIDEDIKIFIMEIFINV